ncbi:hypothetical protein [Actinokineospora xionganensis]|uniref:TrbL/VirB6 plasmid conjugal transfer protein n=1 Tax=Actinokineospora xionganensis TaxID=2684470 RepID=A0ABR7LGC3_9PSEU|nr:hypothetical protein [Actinokineospora xionganensis]MBC6451342.1 hypothetical protein [Actinokineospora xionganensis]
MSLRPPADHHRLPPLPPLALPVLAGVFLVSVLALLTASGGASPVAHAQPPPSSSQPTGPPFSPRPTSPQPAAPTSVPASAVPPIVVVPTSQQPPPPTTGPGAPGPAPGSQPEDPAWYDIPGQITKAINGWFRDLVTAALRPVLDLIGRTVLATPNVTADPRVRDMWGTVALIANTIFVLLVSAGGVLVLSHETLQTRYALRDILPRIVVAFIAANLSLSLVGEGITAANTLSRAVLGMDITPDRVSALLITMLVNPLGAGIFLLLIGLVAAVLALILLATYVVRLALTVLLVVAAPLALALHALPQTDGLARLWWRAIIGCFTIQLAQALTLIVAVRVFFGASGQANPRDWAGGSSPLVDLLVACVLMYVMIRIPTWVFRQVFSGQRSVLVRIAKYALIGKAIGALRGGHLHPGPTAIASPGTRPPGPGGGAPRGAPPRGPRPIPSGPTRAQTVGRAQRGTALSTLPPRAQTTDHRERPGGDAVVLQFPAQQPRPAAPADPRKPKRPQPGAAERSARPSSTGSRPPGSQAPAEAIPAPRTTIATASTSAAPPSPQSTQRHRRRASPPVPAPQPRAPRRVTASPPPPSTLPPKEK